MKRICGILSLTLVLSVTALAETPVPTQNQAEKLSKKQLHALIVTAKTTAEHQRIAQYYEAKAQDFLAQSKKHEQMAEQFKANGVVNSSKWANNTVGHCEYFAKHFQEASVKMQDLASQHEQMAKEAPRN
jgi:hypothetical protein